MKRKTLAETTMHTIVNARVSAAEGIWGHVREHWQSLDSGHHTAAIAKHVSAATETIADHAESLVDKINELNRQLAASRKETREAKRISKWRTTKPTGHDAARGVLLAQLPSGQVCFTSADEIGKHSYPWQVIEKYEART